MSLKIKKGDKVVVISGRDKGKTGKVVKSVLDSGKVIVEGVNLVKKHSRRRSEAEQGGIREIPIAIKIEKIALYCPTCDRGMRFGVKISDDKSKIRICRKCQQPV